MNRKLITAVAAFAFALPAFANTTQLPSAPSTQTSPQVLRLMNDSEFATFLTRLDSNLVRAEQQLKKMDVSSVSVDPQEKLEMLRSYNRCVESLDNARVEIQKLSQRQTLKLDLYLLIDLNQLARNLDSLDESLMNPSMGDASGAKKSLGYAREVLNIDGGLATEISTFQHHFIAFTGIVDSTLEQAEPDSAESQSQK